MKKILIALTILFVLCLGNVYGATNGPLSVNPSTDTNPRYFKDKDGNTVWLSGYHTWANLQDISVNGNNAIFDWSAYITSLKNNGMNHIRLWTLSFSKWNCGAFETKTLFPWNRSSTAGASDGGNKFDLTSFNTTYFTRLATRVADAQANGIYVGVMLFEGYGPQFCRLDAASPNGDGFPFSLTNNINSISDGFVYDANGTKSGVNSMKAPGETGYSATLFTAQKAYIDKVIETIDSYDNVLYEIANEAGGASTAWQDALIAYLRTKTTKPVGKTYMYAGGTNAQLLASSADWVSFGEGTYMYNVTNVPVATTAKVSIIDTDHNGAPFSTSRTYLWKAFTRGHNLISMSDGVDSSTSNLALHRMALAQMRTYVNKMDLKNMPPLGTISNTGYSLEKANSEYLIFQPSNASFSLYFTGIAGIYSVEWANVATGVTTTGSDINGGTTLTMSYPTSSTNTEGVVLYLKKKESPPPTTGTTWYTDSCSNADIQAVINAATTLDGHTVVVKKGSCTWTAPISLTKAITLIGEGSNPNDCVNSTCITSGLENGGRAITSITRSGTTATVTQTDHGFCDEGRAIERIHISGATQPEYNGVKDVTWIDKDRYRFTVSGTPVTPATGTITTGYGMGVHMISAYTSVAKLAYLYRISNMAFNGMDWSYFILYSHGSGQNSFQKTRIDNCFFTNSQYIRNRGIAHSIMYSGFVNGVFDHNTLDARGSNEAVLPTRWAATWSTCPPGTTGNATCQSYSDLIPWDNGTRENVFIEDNTFIYNSYPQMIATGSGGSTVVRYNTFDYSEAPGYFYTQDTHGHQRSYVTAGFGGEVYGNLVKGNPNVSLQSNTLGSFRGNKHKIFYNKYTGNNSYSGVGVQNFYPVKYIEATNPDGFNSFFTCLPGSLYSDTNTCSYDGRNQHPSHTYVWNNRNVRKDVYGQTYDLMINSIGRGGPCRSPTSTYCTTGSPDLTTCFPPIGTCSNYPSPLDYDVRWLRTDKDVDCVDPDTTGCEAPNYEVWYDSVGWNKYHNITTARGFMQTGDYSFNGTVGIGCGTLAARPATCTQGVGYWVPDVSMYSGGADPCGTVPEGSYGANPSKPVKGTLYMCGSSNWSNATTYTPYTYPHPLINPDPISDVTPPVYITGTISPPPTPVIECTPPSVSVPLSFQVTETQTAPVSCLGCVLGTDGCISTSTYNQINSMPSKITFASSQSGTTYTQTATRTSTCGVVHNIYVACVDGNSPSNEMTPNVLINYSTASEIPDTPPGLVSVTLQSDGRTFALLFTEPVKVDVTTQNKGEVAASGVEGSYGLIYARGSDTNTLYYQIANCQVKSSSITMTILADYIYNLVDVAFPGITDKAVVNSSSLTYCGSEWVGTNFPYLFDQTETPPYSLYSQGAGGPTILGTVFFTDLPSRLTKVCFYKDATMDGEEHTGMVFGPSGSNPNTLLAQKVFASETSSGWQCQTLDTPISILTETPYTVAVKFPTVWLKSNNYFDTTFVNYPTGSILEVAPFGGRWVDNLTIVPPLNLTSSNFWVDFELDYQSVTGPWVVGATKTGIGCSVTPASQLIDDADPASVTVTLNTGWGVTWSDTCGGGSADGNVYTVTSVTEGCDITATCSQTLRPPWIRVQP